MLSTRNGLDSSSFTSHVPRPAEQFRLKHGYLWIMIQLWKLGQHHLKIVIEVAKIFKQVFELTGFRSIAYAAKFALIPCMILRSVYFISSPKFSLDTNRLFGTPGDRKNLTLSFLSITTLLAPFPPLFGIREQSEIDELMQIEIGFLKIFSLEETIHEMREKREDSRDGCDAKKKLHIRVLDLIRATSDVALLFIEVSQAPYLVATLGTISFTIGVYTLCYPCLAAAAKKVEDRVFRELFPLSSIHQSLLFSLN